MEYQKVINLLDNTGRTYNANSQIKFKTLILKPIL